MEEIASENLIHGATNQYTKQLLNASFDIYCDQNKEIPVMEVV